MSITPLFRKSSIKSSLVIVLFLGAFCALARFKGDRVGVDHVVIQAVQRAVALIGVLVLVISLACGYLLVTVCNSSHKTLLVPP